MSPAIPAAQQTFTQSGFAETLSTNQLLDMFGGTAAITSTTQSSAAKEPPDDSVAATASSQLGKDDEARKLPAVSDEAGDCFVLPPTAESSSEDESSQEN